ncbi:chromosome segregation protein SMC [Piscinibacter koreensis]|uniref:Chromosome partition protein Smc n=1 Tax=Piscinibacter koreensis TaxID=2742824 RepID=A0A7Y6NR45_9BURK|nr:chromosome segregation protein SMC [Schlegelella koreensis]NUZ07779.1 chromosome segregation protein SMC [Schlegelella koreensis]
MRLNSIKLSGFKSFVEPTHFQLPGQLVGVVGPNGCGKSNIMDAVRWVLGESKASELRGESMQDVIFNGSDLRKPAGRASVELVFNNESGRAGGQWNRFGEIAVKRVLTRDGTSSYYINNQPVRRRDVQDVFLGTGLGPRAYAIIGQGTISRIIESRPEELRLFLEEAAGVSKYKDRRRETEVRLKDTRENLTRVEDILRELNQNLVKLERQAEVAGRYRTLQQQAQLKTHQLWFLRHRDAAAEEARVRQAVIEATTALDARSAQLRDAEAGLEQVREEHFAANEQLHAAQGTLGEAALEVSRLQERIRYVAEGRRRVEERRAELAAQSARWAARRDDALAERASTAERQSGASDDAAQAAVEVETHGKALRDLDAEVREARSRSQTQRSVVAGVQQQLSLLGAEARNINEQRGVALARRGRLAAEEKGLAAPDAELIDKLRAQLAGAEEARAASDARLADASAALPALDEARRASQAELNAESAKHAQLAARLQALRALQERVQVEGKLKPWLARHKLNGVAALWTRIRIEAGWETALEAALRERVGALEVSQLGSVAAFASDAPPARLAFYTPASAAAPRASGALPRLAQLLQPGDPGLDALLADWLSGVYTAPDFATALDARASLGAGEVIMTRDGHAVGAHSVSFYAPDSEQAGLLARAQEIANLDRQTRAQQLIADEAKGAVGRAEAAVAEATTQLGVLRQQAHAAQARAHALQVEWLQTTQRAEQTERRRHQLADELGAIDTQLGELDQRLAGNAERVAALQGELAAVQQRQVELDRAVTEREQALAAARDTLRAAERRAQEAQFSGRSLAARLAELERSIETANQQLAANESADAGLADELASLTDADAQEQLHAALERKAACEAALAAQRRTYDELAQALRRADERRMGIEQGVQPLRDRITKLQLEEQAAQLGAAQYLEQLTSADADLDAVAASIETDSVKLTGLQTQIDRLNREIEALGAVNLAALDELTASRERKTFLDAQNADLTEAMNTLEAAIRQIDLETRELLGTTFEQVNAHFGRMFPTLFGGGNARLVMTGDEILDAGVQVMAQPPGKKNSSIQLLSGGEKALTAIALVFAIFQLNPAPFCLLDEVDAPLDDANTERYAKLVKEMSASTQFLFISHNKIAMEMAQQLIGVTMQEQGVSRIVSVDMPAAMRLAEAA